MYIQVLFNEVLYEKICDYYNFYKPKEWNQLKGLERAEGGFYIDIKHQVIDSNPLSSNHFKKIKQLRWSNKCLITPIGWSNFTNNEITLLYHSLCHVYGENQVLLHINK